MDHFKNPRNMGEMKDADAIGEVGNPTCGDLMYIYIKVKDDIIDDISFQTFGCGAAIATSSMVTELAKGKTLEEASKICEKTPGPVATIIHAGLSRVHKGIDHVEKAVESAGAVEMAFLENGLVWLATIANVAPMLGFFGTVAGMIKAFRAIAEAGHVEPSIVAAGISMALITTAGGLLVAIPIQFGYNLCVYLIDRIVVSMEENASRFIDTLIDLGYDNR